MKNKKEKKYSPISKKASYEMTQFRESPKHTQIIPLGEHISCKIRKMKTIYTDKEAEIGIDIRKFLNDKYPFKEGKQGLTLPESCWPDFVQKVIDFSQSAYPEMFYDEPQLEPQFQQVKNPEQPKVEAKPKKSPEETNWHQLKKEKGKKVDSATQEWVSKNL